MFLVRSRCPNGSQNGAKLEPSQAARPKAKPLRRSLIPISIEKVTFQVISGAYPPLSYPLRGPYHIPLSLVRERGAYIITLVLVAEIRERGDKAAEGVFRTLLSMEVA